MPKIVIIVENGMVEHVFSDTEGIGVRVIDADPWEPGTEQEEAGYAADFGDILVPAAPGVRGDVTRGLMNGMSVDRTQYPYDLPVWV